MTLVAFLRARLAEDEQAARAVQPLGHVTDMGGRRLDDTFTHGRARHRGEDGALHVEGDRAAQVHFSRHDPARVLAEVAAKRRIVDRYTGLQEYAARPYDTDPPYRKHQINALHVVLRDLASVYANHSDYDESWKP